MNYSFVHAITYCILRRYDCTNNLKSLIISDEQNYLEAPKHVLILWASFQHNIHTWSRNVGMVHFCLYMSVNTLLAANIGYFVSQESAKSRATVRERWRRDSELKRNAREKSSRVDGNDWPAGHTTLSVRSDSVTRSQSASSLPSSEHKSVQQTAMQPDTVLPSHTRTIFRISGHGLEHILYYEYPT